MSGMGVAQKITEFQSCKLVSCWSMLLLVQRIHSNVTRGWYTLAVATGDELNGDIRITTVEY